MARRKLTLGWISGITLRINSFQDLSSLLNIIMSSAQEFLDTEAASLMLYDPISDELVFDVVYGEGGDLLNSKRIPADKGIAGLCAHRKEIIVVNDAANDDRVIKSMGTNINFIVRNLIAVPMVVRNNLIGVIEVLNSRGRDKFTRRDERLVAYLANIAALAVRNRQLYDALRSQKSG